MNWRLVTDLAVFIPYSDHEEEQSTVYLGAVDKKTLELSVIKDISGCYDKISIDCNEFQLKIDKSPCCVTFEEDIDLGIYIKSSKYFELLKNVKVRNSHLLFFFLLFL